MKYCYARKEHNGAQEIKMGSQIMRLINTPRKRCHKYNYKLWLILCQPTCKYLNTSSPCPFGHDAVGGVEQRIDDQHLAAMTATMVMIIDSC